jgi:hypothetical protein
MKNWPCAAAPYLRPLPQGPRPPQCPARRRSAMRRPGAERLPGCHGTGLTGAPGTIIFWKPSTMTCSPAFRPSSTTQLPALRATHLYGAAGPPCPRANHQHRVALGRAGHRLLRQRDGVGRTACSRRTRTYRPGSRRPPGLGTSARRRDLAGGGVHGQVGEQQLAWARQFAAVFQHHAHRHGRTLACGLELARFERPAQLQHLGRRLREVDVQRIDLLHHGQLRGLALALTSAPSVTSARPMRPAMGEVTVACPRLMRALRTAAVPAATSASACFCAATALA